MEVLLKDIKVLGSGCSKCRITIAQIERVAQEKDVGIRIDKVQDKQAIISHGVLSTPAVIVEGKLVHAGGVPGRDEIETWFT
jgi:small redox-active disulfide protein 2